MPVVGDDTLATFEPLRLIGALNEHGVAFVVVGGYAAGVQGAEWLTYPVSRSSWTPGAPSRRPLDALDPPWPPGPDERASSRSRIRGAQCSSTNDPGSRDVPGRKHRRSRHHEAPRWPAQGHRPPGDPSDGGGGARGEKGRHVTAARSIPRQGGGRDSRPTHDSQLTADIRCAPPSSWYGLCKRGDARRPGPRSDRSASCHSTAIRADVVSRARGAAARHRPRSTQVCGRSCC
jgi:hypothetical protein